MITSKDTLIDISEDLIYKTPYRTAEQVSDKIWEYLSSDDGCAEVVEKLEFPSELALKIEEKRIERIPTRVSRRRLETIELTKQLIGIQKSLRGQLLDGGNQVMTNHNSFPSQNTPWTPELHSSNVIDTYIVDRQLRNLDMGNNFDYATYGQKTMISEVRKLIGQYEDNVNSGKPMSIANLGTIKIYLKLISSNPYYGRKMYHILEQDYSNRPDKAPMKFVDMLPLNKSAHKERKSRDETNQLRNKIEYLLMKLIAAEVSDTTDEIVSRYIKGEIEYQEYVKEVSEVSRYAAEQWPKE